jgi:hypothetical protein
MPGILQSGGVAEPHFEECPDAILDSTSDEQSPGTRLCGATPPIDVR